MKRFCFILIFAFFAAIPNANAETPPLLYDADLQFVDASGSTGYYIDMNSIVISGDTADALVAIINADDNKLYLHHISFHLKNRQYTVKDVVLYRYEDKQELKKSSCGLAPLTYLPNSPLESLAQYIINPKP